MTDTPPEAPAEPAEPAAITAEPATVDPAVDPETPAGVPHGTIVQDVEGLWHRIVHDVEAETGKILGWHKEHVANEAGDPVPPEGG